jgi:hypothetical protein
VKAKVDEKYEKYSYRNRRAQMYWELAEWMDPQGAHGGFAIPDHTPVYQELRRQLAPIPRRYDEEGRIILPPKRNKPGARKAEPSLEQIIGRSPDDADALVLALFAMTHRVQRPTATMIGAGTV